MFDIQGSPSGKLRIVSRQSSRRGENPDGRVRKRKPHGVGLQISRGVHYGQLRRYLGEVLHKLAEQKQSRIVEGHLMPDHVHMLIAITPKYTVSQVVG